MPQLHRAIVYQLFQTFAGVLLFVTVGVIAVTGVMSFIDAAVVVLTGFGPHYWIIVRQRFVSTALATLTLVPAIVMIGTSSYTFARCDGRAISKARCWRFAHW